MASALQGARLALLRLQAGMVAAEFSKLDSLSLKLLPGDNLEELLNAVHELCGIEPREERNGGPELKSLYGDQDTPTHIVVPPGLVEVPESVVDALKAILANIPAIQSPQVGWMTAVDREDPEHPGLVMRLTMSQEIRRRPKIDNFATTLGEALGLPVTLDVGASPQQHVKNPWSHKAHGDFAAGMSVGTNGARGGTIAMPVSKAGSKSRYFLTAAHLLADPSGKNPVRQPADNENPARQIGAPEQVEYKPGFDDINYFDVALIKSDAHNPSLQFGSVRKFQLVGVHTDELTQGDSAYIYGAASGFLPVRIQFIDTETTMLSTDGNRLIYRDVIEFSRDIDNTRPASLPGDSGAPLLIGRDNRYYVAGLVIGGAGQAGRSGQARSYAVPIRRILDHFKVESL
jgi:hypothetical protein